jgi:hypothetical protein
MRREEERDALAFAEKLNASRHTIHRHSREGGNPACPAHIDLKNSWRQIVPIRISVFDKPEFPRAIPFLHLLFTHNSAFHSFMDFKPHKRMYSVLFCEAFGHFIFVFIEALRQIARDANIKRPVPMAREYIDARLFHSSKARYSPDAPQISISNPRSISLAGTPPRRPQFSSGTS